MARLPGIGLTLSGGGLGGAGSMLGVGAALELFLLSHDVRDFEMFAGISAGALVAAHFAAGYSALDGVRAYFTHERSTMMPVRPRDFYFPNWRELRDVPARALRALVRGVRRRLGNGDGEEPPILGVLPSGPLRADRIGAVLKRNLERAGANDFRQLGCRLTVAFYDLLTSERVVCGNGPGEVDDVPIHEAVLASAAIPGIFAPRRLRIRGRPALAVDGGTAGVSLDVRGAEGLEVLFAYNNADYAELKEIEHASAFKVLGLSLDLLFNQRNLDEIATFIDAHPTRHVITFDAAPNGGGMVSYEALLTMARATFERTRRRLAAEMDYLALILEPRGVRLNAEIADARFEDIVAKGYALKDEIRRRHGIAAAA